MFHCYHLVIFGLPLAMKVSKKTLELVYYESNSICYCFQIILQYKSVDDVLFLPKGKSLNYYMFITLKYRS